jgi:hypothetical protein
LDPERTEQTDWETSIAKSQIASNYHLRQGFYEDIRIVKDHVPQNRCFFVSVDKNH